MGCASAKHNATAIAVARTTEAKLRSELLYIIDYDFLDMVSTSDVDQPSTEMLSCCVVVLQPLGLLRSCQPGHLTVRPHLRLSEPASKHVSVLGTFYATKCLDWV